MFIRICTLIALMNVCLEHAVFAQLSCVNCPGRDTTSYTNAYLNDSLYFICQGETASLHVEWSGDVPNNVHWYRFISTSNTWTLISTQNQVLESSYNATPGGFRVLVTDDSDNVIFEDICWVSRINSPPIVNANTLQPGCGPIQLSGLYLAGNITGYYNPPPVNFEDAYLFNENSDIEICLNITHPILADLSIELVTPAACGSQTILLTDTQTPEETDSICYNSDAVGLCFTNESASIYNLCELSNFDVGGSFSSFGNPAQNIDWAPLIGCDVTQPGWAINIRDCFGGANGSLVSATLIIDEGAVNEIPIHHDFLPVEEQDFTILDTGCDSSLYTVIQLERIYPQSTLLSQGIGIAWETEPAIQLPNNGVGLSLLLDPGPTQDVYFYLSLTNIEISDACGAISYDVEFFDYIEPDSSVIALTDSVLCLGDAGILVTSSIAEGSWSGPVEVTDDGAFFDPALVGTGLWAIAFEPVSACIEPTQVMVLVDEAPQPALITSNSYCDQDTAVNLVASPSGGYWIGEAITDSLAGIFNPSLVSGDNATLTYRVLGNCPIDASVVLEIENFIPLEITSLDSAVCEVAGTVTFLANLPNVVWDGDGITDANQAIFNPAVAGVGEHVVVAMYNQACSSRDTLHIRVDDASIDLTEPNPVCVDAEPLALQVLATPGIWSGTGLIDSLQGIVDPQLLPAGLHYFYYTLSNSCLLRDSVALSVESFPSIQIGLPDGICVDQSDFVLLANFEGGDFSGNGVYTFENQWYFTPQLAGVGLSVLQYDYSDVCTLSVLDTIEIYALPELVISADTSICPEGEATLLASGAFSYGWAPANTLVTPQEALTIAQPDVTTTFAVAGQSAQGCFSTAEVTVEVLESPQLTINGPAELCPGESVILEALGVISAEWSGPSIESPLELSTFVSPTQTTTYELMGFDENGCVGQTSLEVVVPQPVALFIASDTLGTPPMDVQFTNLSNGDYFVWDFGNGDSLITSDLNASATSIYDGAGISVITLTAFLSGCPATYSMEVETYYDSELLLIPNVVSPNGDGKNDVWRLETRNMETMHVDIFNRWGVKVEELDGIDDKWSPDAFATGTYYFHLFATGLDGEAYNREGHITVLCSEN
jgi:gliding motility-associated-like protein